MQKIGQNSLPARKTVCWCNGKESSLRVRRSGVAGFVLRGKEGSLQLVGMDTLCEFFYLVRLLRALFLEVLMRLSPIHPASFSATTTTKSSKTHACDACSIPGGFSHQDALSTAARPCAPNRQNHAHSKKQKPHPTVSPRFTIGTPSKLLLAPLIILSAFYLRSSHHLPDQRRKRWTSQANTQSRCLKLADAMKTGGIVWRSRNLAPNEQFGLEGARVVLCTAIRGTTYLYDVN